MKSFSRSASNNVALYGVVVLVFTFVFSNDSLKTAAEAQSRTDRDGSEALVLGKIFADANDLDTGAANLGFVEKKLRTHGSDVFATYFRLDHPNELLLADINDSNWVRGIGAFGSVFLLPRARVAWFLRSCLFPLAAPSFWSTAWPLDSQQPSTVMRWFE